MPPVRMYTQGDVAQIIASMSFKMISQNEVPRLHVAADKGELILSASEAEKKNLERDV